MKDRTVATLVFLLLAACVRSSSLPEPQIVAATPSFTPFQLPGESVATPTFEGTPDPYAPLTIAALAARTYGEGQLVDLGVAHHLPAFERHLVSFPSDGLTINGFMDIPSGDGPLPVVLVLHGYVEPGIYQIETYTAGYAAAFANNGFIAIHPNYRNYAPSDSGPNEFRVGFAVDVMNLIGIVNAQAGSPGILEKADPDAVFLFGHSMGGGIALRVLTVGADVQGSVLYASMSGDERRNFEHIRDVLSQGGRGNEELAASDEQLQQISPVFSYDRIQVPVSIHHGDADDIVPLEWSEELCLMLQTIGKQVECYTYHNMPHIFIGSNDLLLVERSVDFFRRNIPPD